MVVACCRKYKQSQQPAMLAPLSGGNLTLTCYRGFNYSADVTSDFKTLRRNHFCNSRHVPARGVFQILGEILILDKIIETPFAV